MARRLLSPSTTDVLYDDDQLAFLKAMDAYKRKNDRPFPSLHEVLAVLESLGWRRVAQPTDLPVLDRSTGAGQRVLALRKEHRC